mmetsp:Transcript_21977/g.37590  ORF Transcript_21977/g.37590 Transcript_21977/m.37590 type:complete len:91 (-) Transcript_21977:100-372(-)
MVYSLAAADSGRDSPSRMEQILTLEVMTQMEAHSADLKDVEEKADVDHYAAAAAVPAAAVPEPAFVSVLQVKQVEVEFVNAATVPMDSDP